MKDKIGTTPAQALEHINQWWEDRKQHYTTMSGWSGRDLRNHDQLIQAVIDTEQDISQLLKYTMSIFEWLASGSPEEVTNPKLRNTEEKE